MRQVLANFFILAVACSTICGCRQARHLKPLLAAGTEPRHAGITIKGLGKDDVDLKKEPARMYVWGSGKVQRGARIILSLTGITPGTRVYWSYKYKRGPLKESRIPYPAAFSAYGEYSFNPGDNSTLADEKGETGLLFTSSTYAGDSFQFGVGFIPQRGSQKQFSHAVIKTKPLVLWKRIYLEQPKVLKRVRFPNTTWDWVCISLARLNIEVKGKLVPLELAPAQPGLFHYFSGTGHDLRYGPRVNSDFSTELTDISMRASDSSPRTINVVILGALSKSHDLIKDSPRSPRKPPQPVDYDYPYRKQDVNPQELRSFGTAAALIGDYPTIFIWSDYWWIISKRINSDHDKTLARVILHEIGHHLLRAIMGKAGKILDNQGHILDTATSRPSIMNGYKLAPYSKNGRLDISPLSIHLEKKLIKQPTWNHRVEKLIRQYYIPLKQ